ncbi:unnamed protein product [Triticum turgidum subsp. durum]|uniref:RING-type domain-containing protein n=1 Tax=Triticum turgidum subsp. durum TaxID=4567 RepID=A0A9R0W2Q3_TRITD|nr:unnamed protein product [Triticum turgidum subsp. durum]
MHWQPLSIMPLVAAAATECRLSGEGSIKRDIIINPSEGHRCRVLLHGNLLARYTVQVVGGPRKPTLLHKDAPRKFNQAFELFDPNAFFRSYSVCRDTIHQMLAQTLLLCNIDLAADNWDTFLPHNLATFVADGSRRDTDENGGITLRYNMEMFMTIWVEVIYREPKVLLLACDKRAMVTRCLFAATPTDFILPWFHSFHRGCILPWFYKVAKCPKCRHDLGKYLVAATDASMGKFPGQP